MEFNLTKYVVAAPTKVHAFRHWLFTLGGPGLIILGLIDSSVIPIPGSMDAMTIVLAARDRALWPYYAAMATLGSVTGAYLTYRISRKQGEKALKDRLSPRNVKKVTGGVRTLGIWGDRGSRAFAAADADGSICDCGGCTAVLLQKVSDCDVPRANRSLLHSGLPGGRIRAADVRSVPRTWSSSDAGNVGDCGSRWSRSVADVLQTQARSATTRCDKRIGAKASLTRLSLGIIEKLTSSSE